MLIDIVFLSMMAFALFQGFRNGLIVAIFSILGWILGLFAAFKLAETAAAHLKNTIDVSAQTLYIISFLLVFTVVVLVVNLGAKIVTKTMDFALLGWVNRLGGAFFYVLLYTLIFSVMIYFAEKVKLLNADTIASSQVYPWVKPLAEIIQLPFSH